MPDYNRLLKMNPALLARRIATLEEAMERQFALNDAAARRLVGMQEELAQKGAFVVALLQKCGGRLELTIAELQELQESNLRVQYAYPDENRPTFLMVLSADGGAAPDEERQRSLEARLRAAGVSDEEIAQLKARVDEAAADADRVFGAGAEVGMDPAVPGDDRMASRLVGPDGRPMDPDGKPLESA